MSKKKLAGIVVGCILVIFVVIGVVTGPSEPTKLNISRIGELAVFTEGPGLTVWFNLLDEDGRQVSADGDLEFTIYSTSDKIVYQKETPVSKTDFKRVQRLLGGEKLLVYTWFIPFDEIEKYVSDNGRARLAFTPTGQSPLTPVEVEYVKVPKMSDQEIAELYETRFQETAKTIEQTISNQNFAITLVRVGFFTHLKYDTWGDEVTHLRADLSVENVGNEKDYIFESNAVLLDDLGNQYDAEWSGTLKLGELYPGVKRQGYLIFPLPEKEATRIRLVFTKSAYPGDIKYEFIIQLP